MSLAILISGGLDSAILLGDAVRRGEQVWPLFIRFGLTWEATELHYLRQFLAALAAPHLEPLTILEQPVRDIYGDHWSLTGGNVPAADAPDEAVYLPGRNVLLLAKAMTWCHRHGLAAVALGALASNPFPDATPEFFRDFESVMNRSIGAKVQISRPFGEIQKRSVMHLGRGLPLQLTFSCIQPRNRLHCGQCNKCAERQRAFADAGMGDPTLYAPSALR